MIVQRLFQEKGYDGVGVVDIGRVLGIMLLSFYNVFGSKVVLFDKVFDRYVGSFGCFVFDVLVGCRCGLSVCRMWLHDWQEGRVEVHYLVFGVVGDPYDLVWM